MPHTKLLKIGAHFKSHPDKLLKKWYLQDKLSGSAIAEKVFLEAKITITSRAIHDRLKTLGISREKSSARRVGIQKGRVKYDKLKKPIRSKELRKGISLGLRYKILKRDNFRCTLCGNDSSYIRLVIDHIIPVVRGGNNSEDNLRTLCLSCNHGKMITDNEK